MIELYINDQKFSIENLSYLEKILKEAQANKYNDICLSNSEGNSMTLLTNNNSALLMLLGLDNDSESSYSSRSTSSKSEECESFLLANGQMDEYPKLFLISLELGFGAIIHFYKTGEMFKEVSWNKDY